jgi:large subunit ribosomal protein L28
LDEYLLGEKEARIKELGESGWWLRWAIMQTPSVKKRFKEERKALGITGEPEDVDTVAQGFEAFEANAEEVDQEGVSLEETEPIAMTDDAFEVEQSADLPIIKFRVGPGKHIMLTADGWRRTRPDPQRWKDQKKVKIAQQKFPEYVESRVELFEETLDEKASKLGLFPLPEHERKPLIQAARRFIRRELDDKVEKIYNAREATKEQKGEQRRAAKKQESKQVSSEFPAGLEI